jgi:hypothetical protein
MEIKEKDQNGMFRSKVGEAKEAEKRNNRAILIGLFIILVGSVFFVTARSCAASVFPAHWRH